MSGQMLLSTKKIINRFVSQIISDVETCNWTEQNCEETQSFRTIICASRKETCEVRLGTARSITFLDPTKNPEGYLLKGHNLEGFSLFARF